MIVTMARVVDATHIELETPLATPEGRRIIVSVAEPGANHPERNDWVEAALAALASAYGEGEPEYPPSMVREPNVDYGS